MTGSLTVEVLEGLGGGVAGPAGRRPLTSSLTVEMLEVRLTPAVVTTWTWTGAVNQNWSVAGNWIDSNEQPGVPAAGDSVAFTGQYDQPCTVDAASGGVIHSVFINADFTNTITLERSLTATHTSQDGGTISGAFTYEIPNGGTYLWSEGTLQGVGGPNNLTQIDQGATMTITGPGDLDVTIDGRILANYGVINWTGPAGGGITSIITVVNSGEIQNKTDASFNIGSDSTYTVSGDNDGVDAFINDGVVRVQNNADAAFDITTATTQKGSWLALGPFSVLRFAVQTSFSGIPGNSPLIAGLGEVHFYGIVNVTGTLNITNGATVVAEDGASFSLAGGTMNLSPFLILPPPSLQLTNNQIIGGTLTASSGVQVSISGALDLEGTTFNNSSTVNWTDGNITLTNGAVVNNSGTWLVASTNPVDVTMTGDQSGTFNNNGTFDQNTPNVTTIDTSFTNNGMASLVDIRNGSVSFSGNWQNGAGRVRLRGGTMVVNGNFTNNGTVLVPDSGTIAALTVTNNAAINMATTENTSGTLTIIGVQGQGGNFVQAGTGTLSLQITGDTLNDSLLIAGTMTLDGTLTVTLAPNYMPGNGLTWELLVGGARNGVFAIENKPQGFNNPLYDTNSVTIGN
ncbi:MAG: hypothetical protein L0Z62_19475 [Gemmataceae bacterium]|nr:hypothetical protein [Gemmataceae bacterium]